MTKQLKKLIVVSLLLLGSTGSAFAVSLPGIPESGPMSFHFTDALTPPTSMNDLLRKWNNNQVKVSNFAGLSIIDATNIGNFIFLDLNSVEHQGINGTFRLSAQFGADGAFVGGTVSVTGQINSIGINSVQSLMTATLIEFASDGNLIGFETTNQQCNAVFAAYCIWNESVYLNTTYNKGPVDTSNLYNQQFIASSLTTVPVPASIWLMGSALALMGAAVRRRKTA